MNQEQLSQEEMIEEMENELEDELEYTKARTYYEYAKKGCVEAMYLLGTNDYIFDDMEPYEWLQRAIDQGHAKAWYALGCQYSIPKFSGGLEDDEKEIMCYRHGAYDRLPFQGELQLSLRRRFGHRLLAPLAHLPVLLFPGLRLHTPGRQPLLQGTAYSQSSGRLDADRLLARRFLEFRFVGAVLCPVFDPGKVRVQVGKALHGADTSPPPSVHPGGGLVRLVPVPL